MSTLDKITSGLDKVNQSTLTATIVVAAVGGLITAIKGIIATARENGVDVTAFEPAIAAFDQSIATAETRNAEYEALRAQQRADAVTSTPSVHPLEP